MSYLPDDTFVGLQEMKRLDKTGLDSHLLLTKAIETQVLQMAILRKGQWKSQVIPDWS